MKRLASLRWLELLGRRFILPARSCRPWFEKILSSAKGPTGGFYLENGHKLLLIEIVRAIDGNQLFASCVLGLKRCSETEPCPMHQQVKPIRDMLLDEFSKKHVTELVSGCNPCSYF